MEAIFCLSLPFSLLLFPPSYDSPQQIKALMSAQIKIVISRPRNARKIVSLYRYYDSLYNTRQFLFSFWNVFLITTSCHSGKIVYAFR